MSDLHTLRDAATRPVSRSSSSKLEGGDTSGRHAIRNLARFPDIVQLRIHITHLGIDVYRTKPSDSLDHFVIGMGNILVNLEPSTLK